jgi:outer membrane receptor for ferrienterochelin and colicins
MDEDTRLSTVVTATRSRSTWADSPVATEVLTRRQMLDTGARDLSEALQARSGVELFPSLGGTQVRMQGLGPEYNLIIVDGQRAAGRVNGALDLSRYSVEDVEQLEIVKGPSSVLWGSDALAGIIHVITRPARRPFGANALISYGTLNQVDGRASAEVMAGPFAARGFFVYGQRDAFDLDPSTIATSGSSFRSFQGGARVSYGQRDGPGLFAELRGAGLSRLQRGIDANAAGAVFDRGAQDTLGEFSGLATAVVGPGRLTVAGGLNLFGRRFVLDQRGSSDLDQLQDSADRNALLTTTYDVTVGTHRLLAGLEGLGEFFESPRIVGSQRDRGRLSLFVQDTWAPFRSTRLMVVPGLRVDLDSRFGPVVTPRLAVRADATPELVLRASVGTGFRGPSFQEQFLDFENPGAGYRIDGNAALRPEQSVGGTLSADWQPTRALTVAGSLFWNELRDMIAFDSVTDETGLRFTYQNLARARTRGGEVMTTLAPLQGLSLGLGGSVTDARDLTLDRPIDNQALLRAVAQVRWRLTRIGLTVLVRGAVTSGRPLTDGETMTRYTAPFGIVDARIAKTFFDRFEVFIVGTNLIGAGNVTDLPIAPRAVFGGASFTY